MFQACSISILEQLTATGTGNGTGSGNGNAAQASQPAVVPNAVSAEVTVTAGNSVDSSSTATSTTLNVSNGSLGAIPIQASVISGSGPRFGSVGGGGGGGRFEKTKFSKMAKKVPKTAAEKQAAAQKEKLHNWLFVVVERLRKGETSPTPNENLFVHDGKADIQIELSVRSLEVLEKLKAAGFELVSEKGRTIVIGKIALDKLAALAEIDEVKLILPKI